MRRQDPANMPHVAAWTPTPVGGSRCTFAHVYRRVTLPFEVRWGHHFCPIRHPAIPRYKPGAGQRAYTPDGGANPTRIAVVASTAAATAISTRELRRKSP